MSSLKISLLSLTLFILTIASVYSQANSIVVGYYRSWFRVDYPVEQINFANLTHINHAFAWSEGDGSISMGDNFLYPKLIDLTHQAGKKILVALGGWIFANGSKCFDSCIFYSKYHRFLFKSWL
jgi:GH18 family chitinase